MRGGGECRPVGVVPPGFPFMGIVNVAVPLDILLSKATGTRSTAIDKSWLSKVKRSASVDAMNRSAIEVALDVQVGEGDTRYGQTSNRSFKMSGGTLERFFSTWSKWQGYLLNTTDEFQKGGIEAETQRGIDQLKAAGKIADDSLDAAGTDMAKYRTFQDDTAASAAMQSVHDLGNLVGFGDSGKTLNGKTVHALGAGDIITPFSKVPGNLVARAWDYSPAGIAKGMYDLYGVLKAANDGTVTAAQQAKAVREVGRGLSGTALIAGFAAMALKGVLHVEGDDEDKDVDALRASEGMSGTQLNLSALGRMLNGESTQWQRGDKLMNIGFLEPINAQMTIGALVADDFRENGPSAGGFAKESLSGVFQSLLDLPCMSSLQDLQDGYKYSDAETAGGKIMDAGLSMLANQPTIFLPNALKAVAKGMDDTYRDAYSGETTADQFWDAVKASIPGLRQTLPAKLDNFGREKTYTGDPLLNILNASDLQRYRPQGGCYPCDQEALLRIRAEADHGGPPEKRKRQAGHSAAAAAGGCYPQKPRRPDIPRSRRRIHAGV